MFKKTAGKKIFEFLKPSPNVPKTEIQKKIRDLKVETQKLKGSKAKLDQTLFEKKNQLPLTFKTKKGKSESNREAYKRIQGENTKVLKGMIDDAFKEKKAKGGRVGLKFGSKKSNVQKIKETFGPGSSNPKKSAAKKKKFPDLTGDGKVTFADILKGRGVKRG